MNELNDEIKSRMDVEPKFEPRTENDNGIMNRSQILLVLRWRILWMRLLIGVRLLYDM